MDKLHHLASSGDVNEADEAYDDSDDLEGSEMGGDFERATAVVAKEGLREGLIHGKELDQQKGFNAGYRVGMEIGLVIGDTKACLAHRDVVSANHDSKHGTSAANQCPPSSKEEISLASGVVGSRLSLDNQVENPLASNIDEIEANLRALETFVSKELVPNPNDSCCGGGECRGRRGEERGCDESYGRQLSNFFLTSNSSSKDQMGKADDCLSFALQLRDKMDLMSASVGSYDP